MAINKAEKVPYRHPQFEPMYQVDFKRTSGDPKYDPETNIHKYGCRFMCELAMCQYVAGKKLNREQILQIYQAAVDVRGQNRLKGPDRLYRRMCKSV